MKVHKNHCCCTKILKFQSSYTLDTPILGSVFTDLVQNVNDNVIGVQLKPRGPNGYVPVPESEIAIKDGRLDCAFTGLSYSFLQNSLYELYTTVPFGLSADAYISYLFEQGGVENLNKIASTDGLFMYPMCLLPPETGGWFPKEIQSVEDFKDIRIRIFGLGRNILNNLGAKTVFLPQTSIIPSLKSGLINAVEFSTIEIDAELGLPENLKYWYTPSWNQLSTVLYFVINLKKWKSLSHEQQNLIKLLLKENMYSNYISSNANQIEFLEKYKSQLRTFPDTILNAMRDAWEQWLNEPENEKTKEEYERIKAYSIKYNAYDTIMGRGLN